jgi:hypothetical protein
MFGRPVRPLFAEVDGAPADRDGRPMAEALAAMGGQLDEASKAVEPAATAKALQRAVNDLGDAQVREESPPDGRMANRVLPQLVVDGAIGPRTGEAVRLAMHHVGAPRLGEAFAQRLK